MGGQFCYASWFCVARIVLFVPIRPRLRPYREAVSFDTRTLTTADSEDDPSKPWRQSISSTVNSRGQAFAAHDSLIAAIGKENILFTAATGGPLAAAEIRQYVVASERYLSRR
jgi:hypothetical protein